MHLNACNVLSNTFFSEVKLLVKYLSVWQLTVSIAFDLSLRIGYHTDCSLMVGIQTISDNVVHPTTVKNVNSSLILSTLAGYIEGDLELGNIFLYNKTK
jgi:hypothetical protein